MRRLARFIRLASFVALAVLVSGSRLAFAIEARTSRISTLRLAELPREARDTLALIKRGGPFPFPRRDGGIFGNFEKRLPKRPHGYYREYTVPAPVKPGDSSRVAAAGGRDRGGRCIVVGGGREYYYAEDRYRIFRRIRE
ncbi:MAG: ribonuclease [Candidatus Accumulibacter sp.]|jgi:ribonuclease T1|nr:ribonuclease [Accumulibacter sp.]